MEVNKKSEVPALDAGLDLMEAIQKSEAELSFNELLSSVDVSKASANRMLKVLLRRGYLEKDGKNGRYSAGTMLGQGTGRNSRMLDSLQLISTPVLQDLSNALDDSTILLFYPTYLSLTVANKIEPEGAEKMIELGRCVGNLGRNPWGWVNYFYLSEEEQLKVLDRVDDKAHFVEKLETRKAFYLQHGFAYDDCEIHRHRRRLATPVLLGEKLVAVIGLGASILELTDDKVMSAGKTMVTYSQLLAERL